MWNKKRYEEVKEKCKSEIKNGIKKPYDYMIEYKEMIRIEDYEACKAITEILKPFNYHTEDTHSHILSLKT